MTALWTWAGAAVIAALLTLVLRKDCPSLAFAVALAGGLYVLTGAAAPLREVAQAVAHLLEAAGGGTAIYIPVVKSVGIAAVVRIAGAICRDAGQSALAAQLELAGAAAAVAVCLPLLTQVLVLAGGMLT